MADTHNIVALNIGSQRISMAVFEPADNGGLAIKGYAAEEISADPALEAARIQLTKVVVSSLAKQLGLHHAKARYAISGQSVFTRFVKLPPIQQDNIDQLVTFEAQQHVPFPLNEVVWDYELIEGSEEKEAVIVAIKGDALDEINDAVNESGVATNEVDVAPMAIYNAFRHTYGQLEEPVLLIDIGAKTSDLIYIEGTRFFTRSIPVGGVSITAAIAKEYNVTFDEAEKQKVGNGLVALGGGHTEQLDEAVAALAMVIRNALGRLPAEIARTTNYYRSQHGGSAPRRIMIAGGGANLPYTLEFFKEKLNLPVEYFNPVRNISLIEGVDPQTIQRDGHLMGELVGLGLRGIGQSEINIDLVPSVVEQTREADRRKPFLLGAAAALVGGLAIWAFYQNVSASKAETLASGMQEQRDELAPHKKQLDRMNRKEDALKKIANAYTTLENEHAHWHDALLELRGAFASDVVWITDLSPATGYDPSKVLSPTYNPDMTDNGQAVVEVDFFKSSYGETAMAELRQVKPPEPTSRRERRARKNSKPVTPPAPTTDAIVVRGYWRENPIGQNVVSSLLKRLQENSVAFDFTVPDPENKGKVINLVDDQYISKIMSVTAVPEDPEDLAQSFEITLPLARKAPIK